MARLPPKLLDRAFDALVNPGPPVKKPKSENTPAARAIKAGLKPKSQRDYDNPPRNPPKERQDWMCHAHLADGTGRQCEAARLYGQKVCGAHGGRSPQALVKAKERLALFIPEADRTLLAMIQQREHLPTALNAVKEVYDRVEGTVKNGGVGSGIQVQVGFLMPKNGEQAAIGVRVLSDGQTVDADVVTDDDEEGN